MPKKTTGSTRRNSNTERTKNNIFSTIFYSNSFDNLLNIKLHEESFFTDCIKIGKFEIYPFYNMHGTISTENNSGILSINPIAIIISMPVEDKTTKTSKSTMDTMSNKSSKSSKSSRSNRSSRISNGDRSSSTLLYYFDESLKNKKNSKKILEQFLNELKEN
jgi:hypothetical protein